MTAHTEPKDRIIQALDFRVPSVAREVARSMTPHVGMAKVGPVLFTAAGPPIVEYLRTDLGRGVFLDLKFHDTPEIVAGASKSATELGVSLFTIHSAGGVAMMEAAREAVEEAMTLPFVRERGFERPRILGVIMLTSQKPDDFEREGTLRLNEDAPASSHEAVVSEIAMRRALLAKEVGLDGVIASPRIVKYVRQACGAGFLIATPGVHMIETVGQVIRDGADWAVVGRLLSHSRDPIAIAKRLVVEIAAATAKEG